jgi:hypothetical protein
VRALDLGALRAGVGEPEVQRASPGGVGVGDENGEDPPVVGRERVSVEWATGGA